MVMKVLAILTRFKHHGEHSGYKQILKYIKPIFELGINEDDGVNVGKLKLKYQWLFEWESLRYRKHVDLVHVMYGEDYLRFSPYLFRKIPVVATFHQPAASLEREIYRMLIQNSKLFNYAFCSLFNIEVDHTQIVQQ